MWIRRVLWRNERGIVLILGLLTLLVLGVIGAASTTTSRLEVEIAGNDKTYKEALYAAEIAVVSGEILVDTLTDRVALNEGSTPGRYAKGTKPSWKNSTVWADAGSTTLSLSALPAGVQENVDANSLPRYAIEERTFLEDSKTRGIGVPTGTYSFNVTARGTTKGQRAPLVFLETIYNRRYD